MAERLEKQAWIAAEDEIFLVTLPQGSARSPIPDLIERIYHAESLRPVSRARTILRERIHATVTPSIADLETVKLTAKRMNAPTDRPTPTVVTILPEAPPLPSFELAGLLPGTRIEPEAIPAALERLKQETRRGLEKWYSDRPVSAILLDEAGRVITGAWNTNAVIRTRHAEWNLCESLATWATGGKIPAGAKLYVSLKPCRMCAARIWEAATDPARLSVTYFENDPGPLAQGTILDARSQARVRYLGPSHPLFAAELSRLGR